MFSYNSFSVRGLPRTYSLNLCLFNISFVILTLEMVTYNLVVAAIQKLHGYFKEIISLFLEKPCIYAKYLTYHIPDNI
jgi:hypothetical protein